MQLAAAALARAQEQLLGLAADMARIEADPLCQAHVKAAEAARSAIVDLAKKVAAAESTRRAYEEARARTCEVRDA